MFISICLFLIKWIYPFFEFFNEDLILKTINESESDGYYYFPLIRYLSDLTFNLSFEQGIDDLNLIPIPLGGILFHSLLLKITNNFFITILIIEFISLFLFLTIFYFLFRIVFKSQISIILSLTILFIPLFINLLNLDSFPYVNLLKNNLYNSRVPRPLIVNLYYFSLIYLLVKYKSQVLFNKRISIFFSIIFCLLLTSFYYYSSVIFILFLILIFKNKTYIFQNLKNINYIHLLSGLVFLIPFIVLMYFHESDFMERMGSINLNFENKKKLIYFYIIKYTEIKLLLVILLNSLIYLLLVKKKLANNLIQIFYYLIFSSLIAPIFFIIVSPKINIYYHFNNTIVLQNILFFLFALTILLKKYILKFLNLKITYVICLIFIFLSVYENNHKFKKNEQNRNDIIELIQSIENNRNITSQSNLMTLDPKIMVWLILNDFKKIKILNGNFTSKENYMIENDLIYSLKVLNFNKEEFQTFIENKDRGWRYLNENMQKFFFQRYIANSFITYKNSNDFTDDEIKKIDNTSAFIVQQSILPTSEINRFNKLYEDFPSLNNKLDSLPDFLILKAEEFKGNNKQYNFNYCNIYRNKTYEIYQLNLNKLNC